MGFISHGICQINADVRVDVVALMEMQSEQKVDIVEVSLIIKHGSCRNTLSECRNYHVNSDWFLSRQKCGCSWTYNVEMAEFKESIGLGD